MRCGMTLSRFAAGQRVWRDDGSWMSVRVFVLRDVFGFGCDEIADAIDKTATTPHPLQRVVDVQVGTLVNASLGQCRSSGTQGRSPIAAQDQLKADPPPNRKHDIRTCLVGRPNCLPMPLNDRLPGKRRLPRSTGSGLWEKSGSRTDR